MIGFSQDQFIIFKYKIKNMKVKELIEKLSKMDSEKQVYITDDNDDLGYPFYHQCLDAYEITVEEEEIVKILYRP